MSTGENGLERRPRASWGAGALLLVCAASAPATGQVEQERAESYFQEAAVLCEREGGRLWGISLCGPMVFADARTGTIATSQPAPDAPRPRVLGYANAALEWGDHRWSTFVWQTIPKEEGARARLMLHELFHRIQPSLGLYIAETPGENDHLDTPEGRSWMQLEWRALAAALDTCGPAALSALRDALSFRSARRAAFAGAAERERISEINEGLAQYTATVAASSPAGAAADAVAQLTDAAARESFVRSFAYASGAAYGVLLDRWSSGWTRRITDSDDLAELLMTATGVGPAASVEAAAAGYEGPALWAAEQEREAARQARAAELRARFVEGPVLVVPRGRNASFVTAGVTPIPGVGTIYPRFRVSGEWGSIEAEQVLVSPDGSTLTVPGPFTREGRVLSGDGWTVRLEPSWTLSPGPREGDHRVVSD